MSLAVTGLLLLQLGWIRNVHKLTEQKFHEDVTNALKQTALDMERIEAAQLMSPHAFEQSLEGTLDEIVKNEFGGVIQSPGESISVIDTFIFMDGEKTKWLKVQGVLIDTTTGLRAEHRAIFKDQRGIVPIEVDDAMLGLEDDTNSFMVQWNESFEEQVQRKANYMNWMMERMFSTNPVGDIRLRLDLDSLDKVIEFNFLQNGIDTTFRFSIHHIDSLGDRIVDFENKSRHYDLGLYKSDMSALLYPSDAIPSEYQLMVAFPGQGLYVWKEMAGTLIASILLVLVVMFAFYFAVSTIVRQKQLSEIKNDFISNMTHELRTPISTISLACEAVKDPDISKDETTLNSFITMIDQENKRLGKLVENVLQTALIDKGKLRINPEPLHIDQLVQQVVDSFQIRYKDKGGEIRIEKMDPVMWEVDKIHFVNVIYNLLDNSLKYCDQKPEVEVRLEKTGRGFSLEVKDNGIGIRKEDQKRIFEKLYRVPTGDIHNVKGFGLGLSYVASVVQLHKGTISLKSALGKGSTFKIIIHE
jgi:two-component system, OmpR family, phosphate regulon sensor histidine kinase PhoR